MITNGIVSGCSKSALPSPWVPASVPGFPSSYALGQDVGLMRLSTPCHWWPRVPSLARSSLELWTLITCQWSMTRSRVVRIPVPLTLPLGSPLPLRASPTVLNTLLEPSSPGPIPRPQMLELLPAGVPGCPLSRCCLGPAWIGSVPNIATL